jgi:hypothetical protein
MNRFNFAAPQELADKAEGVGARLSFYDLREFGIYSPL